MKKRIKLVMWQFLEILAANVHQQLWKLSIFLWGFAFAPSSTESFHFVLWRTSKISPCTRKINGMHEPTKVSIWKFITIVIVSKIGL